MTTTTLAPKTASEIAFLYQNYLKDLSEKKDIEKLKVDLNLASGESIGDLSQLDLKIVETPVFYDDDINVAFNIEVVKGNSKDLNVDKHVQRLYISVPNPKNKEETDVYLQKYMANVLDVTADCINVTEISKNKKLIYVPQSEIKAMDAIDKIVSTLSKTVLVNETHSLTKNLKKLYEDLVDIPTKLPLPMKNLFAILPTRSAPLRQLEIKPDIPFYRKVNRNISKDIEIVHDAKGNIIFIVDRLKGNCNRILDIQGSLLRIQILAPDYDSAQEEELTRYLSGVFMISRSDVVLEQIIGSHLVKILLKKLSIEPKIVIKKLLDEYNNGGLE